MADYLANKSMDTQTSWRWQIPEADALITRCLGVIMFSDGGYRPTSNLAAAGWVVVAICEMKPDDASSESCPFYRINLLNDPFSTVDNLRAIKVAEGARFLPTCKSSFEAELLAVSELAMHVDSLAVPGPLPPYTAEHNSSMDD